MNKSSIPGPFPSWYSTHVEAKVCVPALPSHMLARPQIVARLNAEVQRKLTLVSAPAGFGKTTLLSAWAQQSPGPVAWVSLDQSDNDPVRFWHSVLAALEAHFPVACKHALELLHVPYLAPIESVLAVLLNALAAVRQDFVLILDDYQVIEVASIHQAVAFLLQHLPPHMHLIIASRTDPPVPLARLRARGHLFTLDPTELLFTPDEAHAFLKEVLDQELPPEISTLLHVRTEGWVTGLHLFVHALRGSATVDQILAGYDGSHAYLQDYLTEEVFQHLPDHLQAFLLDTALVDRLNSSLCDALTGRTDSQMVLELLERLNLFLIPLDMHRCWYRYHQLFADFLRFRLHRVRREHISVLHFRACEWYANNGFATEAVSHALAGVESEQVAAFVARYGREMVRRNELATVRTWLEALPVELVHARPPLCLLQAWIDIAAGHFAEANSWLQEARKQLEGEGKDSVAVSLTRTQLEESGELQGLLGEIVALQSYVAAIQGKTAETIDLARAAEEYLPASDRFLRCASLLNLGIGYWLSDNVEMAECVLVQAIAQGQILENNYFVLVATATLAQVQVVLGRRHLAFQTGQRALRLAAAEKQGSHLAASFAYVGMGQMLYEWNDLEEASRHLEEGLALAERWNNREMLVYGYTALAQVKQAQQDSSGASAMLQQASLYLTENQKPFLFGRIMAAQQVRLALLQKNEALVERWTPTAENAYIETFEHLTLARIALARNQPEQALHTLEGQLEKARITKRNGSAIEILMLEALAHQARRDLPKARETLEAALLLAEPEGYLRLFVDEGEPMATLLSTIRTMRQKADRSSLIQLASCEYLNKLLEVFERNTPEVATVCGDSLRSLPLGTFDQLSEREFEVVQWLTAGASTNEVARRMTITENTVKWYIKDIYSKLGIHSRTQLILWAREVGISPAVRKGEGEFLVYAQTRNIPEY